MNSASLSTNFLISHGQATRSTFTYSRVIHFMVSSFCFTTGKSALDDQLCARKQQQRQHDLAKRCFVDFSVELQSEPGASKQDRKSEQEQPDRFRRDRDFCAKPGRAHGKNCDRDRLEYCPLLVFRPAPQTAPYRYENAGKARKSREH